MKGGIASVLWKAMDDAVLQNTVPFALPSFVCESTDPSACQILTNETVKKA